MERIVSGIRSSPLGGTPAYETGNTGKEIRGHLHDRCLSRGARAYEEPENRERHFWTTGGFGLTESAFVQEVTHCEMGTSTSYIYLVVHFL